ncbi:FMN-dependent NADH-azoreductase [Streptomyces ipomoeae]|uniref:FMN-dependent NADH-azoreductase n=1 Tax=Streptomyces ipomoeae TaxID=103232 RepID=UPI0011465316|nr:NAD(P)H-dependent oxidoreductase [Streptomyces ipomoeae]TQE34883.1 FMN-dependent NADH-azoreductase [Streptomyces ipomoeae]
MATLLHLDSSVLPADASTSRAVTEAFRKAWEDQHPDGTVIYRDLHAAPEQAAAFAEREKLITELEQADAILIGAPMYNFSIPSTLKAWLDNVILIGRTAMTEDSKIKGTPVTVVASRGGSYAPGTPREPFEYVQNYLTALLSDTLALDVDFIVPELTMAPQNPAMSELIPLFEASRAKAFEDAAIKAKTLAERLAA